MGLLISTSLLVVLGTLIIFQNFESIFLFSTLADDSAFLFSTLADDSAMINIGERLFASNVSAGAVVLSLFVFFYIFYTDSKKKGKNNLSKYFFVAALSSIASIVAGVLSAIYYQISVNSYQKIYMSILALLITIILIILITEKDKLYPANDLSWPEILIVLCFQCGAVLYLVPKIKPF
jgi:hypothetical protein